MKLQSLGIVFAIIILPMVIILTYYVQMQVDTIALQTSYDSKLLKATHDAMSAFEINTANEDLSAVSDSLRTIIEASNNIFFNTLATNFGISNASKSNIEPYIPAILYTLYDGYYNYSPTEQPVIIKYGYEYKQRDDTYIEVAMTQEKIEQVYTGENESKKSLIGQPIYDSEGKLQYLKKDGSFTSNVSDTNLVYIQQNMLKSYMPYSARYVREADSIDITVNYTLDNYLNIVGTIKDVYYTKTGYLIKEDVLKSVKENGTTDITDSILNFNENTAEEYVLSNKHNLEITLEDNGITTTISMNGEEGNTIAQKKEDLTKLYEDYQSQYIAYRTAYNTANSDGLSVEQQNEANANLENAQDTLNETIGKIRNMEYEIQNAEAIAYYIRSTIFSKWVYKYLKDIEEGDIKEEVTSMNEGTLSTTTQKSIQSNNNNNLYKNVFDKFDGKKGKVFAKGQDIDGDSVFASHKAQVIRNSIQYNLNVAFSSYSAMSSGRFTFEMPIMTDDEWEKITSRVSIVAYMQGMSCGSKNYSNYALVTSTNNELTVIPEEIYYVEKDKFNDEESECHRIDCTEFDPNDTTSEEYIAFTSKEVKYDKIYNKQTKKYEYDHKNLSCYNCIINRNYIRDNNDEESYVEGIDFANLAANHPNKMRAYYKAIGALRQGLYKTNALTMSEGYCNNKTNTVSKVFGTGSQEISLDVGNLKRPLGEVKGIKIILNNLRSDDRRETTVNFDVLINGQSIGQKTLATSDYSRNQTIELDVNPTLFMGNSATNITVSLRRTLTTSKVSFNQAYISIIYK